MTSFLLGVVSKKQAGVELSLTIRLWACLGLMVGRFGAECGPLHPPPMHPASLRQLDASMGKHFLWDLVLSHGADLNHQSKPPKQGPALIKLQKRCGLQQVARLWRSQALLQAREHVAPGRHGRNTRGSARTCLVVVGRMNSFGASLVELTRTRLGEHLLETCLWISITQLRSTPNAVSCRGKLREPPQNETADIIPHGSQQEASTGTCQWHRSLCHFVFVCAIRTRQTANQGEEAQDLRSQSVGLLKPP